MNYPKKIKIIGHPLKIFNENKKEIIVRYFFSTILKDIRSQKLMRVGIKNRKQISFSISKLFFAFFSSNIRKNRFDSQIKDFRKKKSNNKLILLKFSTFSGQNLYKTPFFMNIIEKKENKKTVDIYRKYPVYSFCFLNHEDILVTNSLKGKIEVNKFRRKRPIFCLKSQFTNFMKLSNSTVFPGLFEASGGIQTNLFNYCSNINKLQIFSLKHTLFLSFATFRKEENLLDYCYNGRIWKSFDITSEKKISNYSFHEKISSIDKSPDVPIFAITKEKSVNVFDSRIGKIVIILRVCEKKITSVKWYPNFPKLISSGTSNNTTLFDLRFPSYGKIFELHKNSISMLNLDQTKNMLITSSLDKTSKIWLKKEFNLYKTFYDNEKKLASNAFSFSGKYIGSLDMNNNLKIWPL
jgi:hypothetical protein